MEENNSNISQEELAAKSNEIVQRLLELLYGNKIVGQKSLGICQ